MPQKWRKIFDPPIPPLSRTPPPMPRGSVSRTELQSPPMGYTWGNNTCNARNSASIPGALRNLTSETWSLAH